MTAFLSETGIMTNTSDGKNRIFCAIEILKANPPISMGYGIHLSHLGRAGVPPKTAQILARHSNISLTMNIYTHVDQAVQVDAINVLPGDSDPVGQKDRKPFHNQ